MHLHVEGSHDAWEVVDWQGFVIHDTPFETELEAVAHMIEVTAEAETYLTALQEDYDA